jgi:integrase/recombinase XerD
MSALGAALCDYLGVRRALGYKLTEAGRALPRFVAHLEASGADTVTVAAALMWATETGGGGGVARRLQAIRGFASYLQAIDPAHEVPAAGLVPTRPKRLVPHLYSEADIVALMAAARRLDPPLRAATTETVIGLLAVTGMRIGEVLALNTADVDWDTGVLTVWLAKFNKSRHVPLAPSATSALADYRHACRRLAPTASTRALFVTPRGRRLGYCGFRDVFARLLDTTGIASAASRRPRIHDFRHGFAVRTILGWYRDGADVHALLPRLSTYLGHVDPASTYWYLSAAPELMALVAERLERSGEASR